MTSKIQLELIILEYLLYSKFFYEIDFCRNSLDKFPLFLHVLSQRDQNWGPAKWSSCLFGGK